MTIKMLYPPDHAAWLAERLKRLQASEAATIVVPRVDLPGWWSTTAYQIWARKTGRETAPEPTEAQALRFEIGHEAQPVIARMYAKRTGRVVDDPGPYTIWTDSHQPWLGATLDGVVTAVGAQGAKGLGAGEWKWISPRMRRDWVDDTPPIYVQVQVAVQLICSGLSWGSVGALAGNEAFISWDTPNDWQNVLEWIAETTERWWQTHIVGDTPPEVVAEDLDTLRRLFSTPAPKTTISLPASLLDAADDWEQAHTAKLECEKHEKDAKARLLAAVADNEVGILPDGRECLRVVVKDSTTACPRCGGEVVTRRGSTQFRLKGAKEE